MCGKRWAGGFARVDRRSRLLRIIPRGGVGAECGVFEGQFSRVLWRRCRPRRLFLVDTWGAVVKMRRPWRVGGAVCWSEVVGGGDPALAKVAEWAGRPGRQNRVEVLRRDSVAWLRSLPAGSLDWVYLDSDHTFAHVSAELAAAAVAVRPGGWLLGHDWGEVLPGVTAAVSEFVWRTGRAVDFLTAEKPVPVWPRRDWMPAWAAFDSWAVRV